MLKIYFLQPLCLPAKAFFTKCSEFEIFLPEQSDLGNDLVLILERFSSTQKLLLDYNCIRLTRLSRLYFCFLF